MFSDKKSQAVPTSSTEDVKEQPHDATLQQGIAPPPTATRPIQGRNQVIHRGQKESVIFSPALIEAYPNLLLLLGQRGINDQGTQTELLTQLNEIALEKQLLVEAMTLHLEILINAHFAGLTPRNRPGTPTPAAYRAMMGADPSTAEQTTLQFARDHQAVFRALRQKSGAAENFFALLAASGRQEGFGVPGGGIGTINLRPGSAQSEEPPGRMPSPTRAPVSRDPGR